MAGWLAGWLAGWAARGASGWLQVGSRGLSLVAAHDAAKPASHRTAILRPPDPPQYKGHTFHAVDTPGHADFGGEVERCAWERGGCRRHRCRCPAALPLPRCTSLPRPYRPYLQGAGHGGRRGAAGGCQRGAAQPDQGGPSRAGLRGRAACLPAASRLPVGCPKAAAALQRSAAHSAPLLLLHLGSTVPPSLCPLHPTPRSLWWRRR